MATVKVGAWGGDGGGPWEFIPDGKVTGIKIRSGGAVDSICFIVQTRNGTTNQSGTFGGNGGWFHEISFANGEEIIKISGRIGEYENQTLVTSLTFQTNKNTYGQYGTLPGTDFSLPVSKGKFVGFHGRCGTYLNSIGFTLGP